MSGGGGKVPIDGATLHRQKTLLVELCGLGDLFVAMWETQHIHKITDTTNADFIPNAVRSYTFCHLIHLSYTIKNLISSTIENYEFEKIIISHNIYIHKVFLLILPSRYKER